MLGLLVGGLIQLVGMGNAQAADAATIRTSLATPVLNDTGLRLCLESDDVTETDQCSDSGQDAATGRDVAYDDDSDGKGGFAFVKVGLKGRELARAAPQWACVKDQVTGLLWEVKTDDGGMRDYHWRYTNHGDKRFGDASSFVDAVNAEGLCGRSSWRLPTRQELQSVVDYGRASGTSAIDLNWFPNTAYAYSWTSTSYVGATQASWAVSFERRVKVYFAKRHQNYAVRLVSGEAPPAPVYTFADDEVHDSSTGLIWKRCSEGQVWTGTSCEGDLVLRLWGRAVEYAQARASETGVPWRLPNPKEIASIIDSTRYGPTVDPVVFPNTPSLRFWTSSFDPGSTSGAFFANFQHGGIADHDRHRYYPIRLVRDAVAAR
ncbi:MAG TPA: DUF1566 domain-containing protein [Ideonella sp.]|nr:DUF1566 domain-containing protein [Ideonella sp.]